MNCIFHSSVVYAVYMFYVISAIFVPGQRMYVSNPSYPLCLLWHSFNGQPVRHENKTMGTLVENETGGRNYFVHLWETLSKASKQQFLQLKHHILSVGTYRTGVQEYVGSLKRTLCQHCYTGGVRTWCIAVWHWLLSQATVQCALRSWQTATLHQTVDYASD